MNWLTDTLIVTGALIALVLAVRGPVARLFGPGMAYALWALPLLRLFVPPLTVRTPPAAAPEPVYVAAVAEPTPAAAATRAPGLVETLWTYAPLFQAVWLAGVLGYLGWRVWQYREMRRTLLDDAVRVGTAGKVRLIESPATRSPVAFGLTDKVVALPPGFMAQMPRRERDLAIAHELEHHKGRDLAINIAMQPLLALHWFNPIAWAGWRALRRDQEAACDCRVLAGREPALREVYGRLIAGFATRNSPALASPLACPILLEKSIIHRLRSLNMTEPTAARRLAGRLLIGAAALALPLTATITYAAADAPDAPQPPAAPSVPSAPTPPEAPEAPSAPGKMKVHKVQKVVIVDVPEGAAIEDKKLHTRTVERDGKTIVLKTATPLSDAEAEARIAKAEASMAQGKHFAWASSYAPKPGQPQVARHVMVMKHGDAAAHAGKGEHREMRVMMLGGAGPEGAKVMMHGDGMAMAPCAGGKPISASAETGEGDKKTRRVVMVCSHAGEKGAALGAMRKARAKVSADPSLPSEMKAEVLRGLDEEITRLEKAG